MESEWGVGGGVGKLGKRRHTGSRATGEREDEFKNYPANLTAGVQYLCI